MALNGWILDKSAAARAEEPQIRTVIDELAGSLHLCAAGELEQLYSARSAREYDRLQAALHETFDVVPAPPDLLTRALALQRELAHHRGMWHRMPIPDLLIAETALYHGMGVVHVDGDFERIARVRPLTTRHLGASRPAEG